MLHIETELENYSYKPLLQSRTIQVTDARWGLCSIAIVPEGSEGRQEFQGPFVPGPFGFVTVHAAVIDNHGGSGREMSQAIKIRLGEPLTVQGLPGVWTFAERDQRRLQGDGVRLIPHGADPATVGIYANPSDAPMQPLAGTIDDMVLEALDQLTGQIHERVLDETGDPGAHDARLWQRIRDSLEISTRAQLEAAARIAFDRERIARERANGTMFDPERQV